MNILQCFKKFVLEIWNDIMLSVIIVVPILVGLFFKFGIPLTESYIVKSLDISSFLSPYYIIFDIILMLIPSSMFAFAAVMVMLEQLDNGIAKYLVVTPLGKSGYLISQIILPTIIFFIYTIVNTFIFKLTDITFIQIFLTSIITSLIGIVNSFIIITFSHNKIEGLALSKFSALIILGTLIPFFVNTKIKYLASFLPTFWIGQFYISNNYIFIIIALCLCTITCYFSYTKFNHKLI